MSTASSTIPLWGQAWELTVTYATSSGQSSSTLSYSGWDQEPLRITFDVQQIFADSPFWYADISIYNLSDEDMVNTFLNATWVVLKAGFISGPCRYSTIWESGVFQVLYDRENVVDQKITLHCVASPVGSDGKGLADPVAVAVGPMSSQNTLMAMMVEAVGLPPVSPSGSTQSQTAYNLMQAKRYPRGNGVFGAPNKFMNVIASDNNIFKFHDGRKVYISDLNSEDWTPDLYYAPAQPYTGKNTPQALAAGVTASIIGDPQQTPFGVDFMVLLDPRVRIQLPPMIVQLDKSTFFRQLPLTPDVNSELPSRLGSDLKFIVGKVRHVGDSRGNEWTTYITAFTNTYAAFLINGEFSPNS